MFLKTLGSQNSAAKRQRNAVSNKRIDKGCCVAYLKNLSLHRFRLVKDKR